MYSLQLIDVVEEKPTSKSIKELLPIILNSKGLIDSFLKDGARDPVFTLFKDGEPVLKVCRFSSSVILNFNVLKEDPDFLSLFDASSLDIFSTFDSIINKEPLNTLPKKVLKSILFLETNQAQVEKTDGYFSFDGSSFLYVENKEKISLPLEDLISIVFKVNSSLGELTLKIEFLTSL